MMSFTPLLRKGTFCLSVLAGLLAGFARAEHGMDQAWVFNRAMVWLDKASGTPGTVLCYSNQSPLWLTGRKQVSRWYAGPGAELADVDDQFTRFVTKDPKLESDHVALPPFQFAIQQHPVAQLEVTEATHLWQFAVRVKGRTGEPLYASSWQRGPGRLSVELLQLYRAKGYRGNFAEMQFVLTTTNGKPDEEAKLTFALHLEGRAAIVPSLPVIRTVQKAAADGVPVCAVVLDEKAARLGKAAVAVTAAVREATVALEESGDGIWKGRLRGLPAGQYTARITAKWLQADRPPLEATLLIHVTDGQHVNYDPQLRLLTKAGRPLGPVTGSYHSTAMFRRPGTREESLVAGQKEWEAARKEGVASHSWESLTEKELDADYAYLARCGWTMIHLCGGWSSQERTDAGGHLAPHAAEQLVQVAMAAERHGLLVHFALSHYPYGQYTPHYAQYLEAGYQRQDYGNVQSAFYRMFKDYLAEFVAVFADETAISSYTAAGEGDIACGKTFVNEVYDFLQTRGDPHLVLCEPHHSLNRDPNYYRKEGWKPLLGGMRTYHIEHLPVEAIGVQYKFAAMGDVFLAEGVCWGWGIFKDASERPERYRQRVRETIYTGLAYRNPILLTWGEQVVQDERVVFEQVRRAVDWSKPFMRPPLAIRIGPESMVKEGHQALCRYELALSQIPLEYSFVWQDEPAPPETRQTIDARQPWRQPAFVSQGGALPDGLRAEMPLRLSAGVAANYSWSRDRRVLLAYVRSLPAEGSPAGPAPAQPTAGRSITLENFPAGRLTARLFDLEAKKCVREAAFEKTLNLELFGSGGYFLCVGE